MGVMPALLFAICVTIWGTYISAPATIAFAGVVPLTGGLITGLILGGPLNGLIAGGYISMAYLGWVTVGGTLPSNQYLAGYFGTALTIMAAADPATAPALAIPIGLIGTLGHQAQMTVNSLFVHQGDKYAAQGNTKGIFIMQAIAPLALNAVLYGVPAFLLIMYGSGVADLFQQIPDKLVTGLSYTGAIMPALGIAMLLYYMNKKYLLPYFAIGFFAVKYLNLGLMSMALFGGFIAIIYFTQQVKRGGQDAVSAQEEVQELVDDVEMTKKLTKKELFSCFFRWVNWAQQCYNYERLQAMGFAFSMSPAINKLYTTKEDKALALQRHMVFFNTEPAHFGVSILGITLAMEERKANGAQISDDDINAVKLGLMGPMAGVGDSWFQGIVFPLLVSLAAGLAVEGNYIAPFVFFIPFIVQRYAIGWFTFKLGYTKGKIAIANIFENHKFTTAIEALSILGMFVIGAMAALRVTIGLDINIIAGSTSLSIQSVLDSIAPGIIPLALVAIIYKLVAKKINPIIIVLLVFVIGILGSYLGFLAA